MKTNVTEFSGSRESSPDIGWVTPHCRGFCTFEKVNTAMSNNEAAHGQLRQQEGFFNLPSARRAHREQADVKFSIPNSVSGLGALRRQRRSSSAGSEESLVYWERETRGRSIGMLVFAPSFDNSLTPTDIPNTLKTFLDGKINPHELPIGPNHRVAQHFGKATPYGQECQHYRYPSRERSHLFLRELRYKSQFPKAIKMS
ncbi:hypothetical protein N7486_008018 [Penicillium sp. IBT 16267x]|nr:hypothetical protein N7486_008018 [Penicillium sp. IBT 16267x]